MPNAGKALERRAVGAKKAVCLQGEGEGGPAKEKKLQSKVEKSREDLERSCSVRGKVVWLRCTGGRQEPSLHHMLIIMILQEQQGTMKSFKWRGWD